MTFKTIKIFIVSFLFIIAIFSLICSAKDKVIFYYFWGEDCHNCEQAKYYIEEYKKNIIKILHTKVMKSLITKKIKKYIKT